MLELFALVPVITIALIVFALVYWVMRPRSKSAAVNVNASVLSPVVGPMAYAPDPPRDPTFLEAEAMILANRRRKQQKAAREELFEAMGVVGGDESVVETAPVRARKST